MGNQPHTIATPPPCNTSSHIATGTNLVFFLFIFSKSYTIKLQNLMGGKNACHFHQPWSFGPHVAGYQIQNDTHLFKLKTGAIYHPVHRGGSPVSPGPQQGSPRRRALRALQSPPDLRREEMGRRHTIFSDSAATIDRITTDRLGLGQRLGQTKRMSGL